MTDSQNFPFSLLNSVGEKIIFPVMAEAATSINHLRIKGVNPRRNFPKKVSLKRGESNFLRAFERAYLDSFRREGVVLQDFPLSGYGIPDLIWIAWSRGKQEGVVLSIEKIRRHLQKQQLVAFEIKLKDWRRALMQAHRYRYFSDKTVVVLPEQVADIAEKGLALFRQLGVGLWSFDAKDQRIRWRFDPQGTEARNLKARERAIDNILSQLKFCLVAKEANSLG